MINKLYPLNDGIGYVELYDWMGTEQTIIDRARTCYQTKDKATPEKDQSLLKQLVGSKIMHGTTLRGVVMSFNVKLPLFVMRQWTRHLIGHYYLMPEETTLDIFEMENIDIAGSYDEMSLRYVDARNLEFYNPKYFRPNWNDTQELYWNFAQENMVAHYEQLRDFRIPKELARSYIPQNVYTEMHWTTNLQACLDWASKREIGSGAQSEHTAYAVAVIDLVKDLVAPEVIKIWKDKQ
jgi:thymidylate synthase ThyX